MFSYYIGKEAFQLALADFDDAVSIYAVLPSGDYIRCHFTWQESHEQISRLKQLSCIVGTIGRRVPIIVHQKGSDRPSRDAALDAVSAIRSMRYGSVSIVTKITANIFGESKPTPAAKTAKKRKAKKCTNHK